MHKSRDPLAVALQASWTTIVWSLSSGIASAVIGLKTHSLSLTGLGLTVLIDVASSVVLVWRFEHERSGGQSVEGAERVAHKVASSALLALGVVLAVQASRNLAGRTKPMVSTSGMILVAAGALVLPILARWKYRAAKAVSSAALRADAHITAVAATMALVTLTGLLATGLWGWWWADAIASLILAAVAIRQSWPGLRS